MSKPMVAGAATAAVAGAAAAVPAPMVVAMVVASSSPAQASACTCTSACAGAAARTTDWMSPGPARRECCGGSTPANCPALDRAGPRRHRRAFGSGAPRKTPGPWFWCSAAATIPSQDRLDGSTDAQGNALYIIDALNGSLLWHATPTGSDFNAEDMRYSIPADIRVIDLNTDGFADRFYAADMGGQVWRFDVFNGRTAGSLISGGVIARLGGAPDAAPTAAETRRFYYAPDIAIARVGTRRFIHIGIGSGHRASPNSLATRDRFFALRDHAVYKPLTQSEYAAMTPITDADLIDITDNLRRAIPFDSPGWRLDLNDGGWRGEKVLAESRTFNNRVFFTTFTPADEAQGSIDNCQPAPGTNRLYVVSLFNGDPVRNFDRLGDDAQLTEADRSLEVPGSIAGEPVFLFPPPENPECVGAECAPPPLACVGLTCLPTGFDNAPVRTYWRQETGQ